MNTIERILVACCILIALWLIAAGVNGMMQAMQFTAWPAT